MAKIPPELQKRIAKARNDRNLRQSLINGYLRMADPVRPRIGENLKSPADRSSEVDDRFDSSLEENAEDFASDLIARTMPRDKEWLAYEPIETLSDEEKAFLKDPLRARTKAIFAAIRASNFYEEAAGEWAWDQGHGTSALISYDPGAGQPHCWEAIAPGQLLIGKGHRGINFKARESVHEIGELMAYWPKWQWPVELTQRTDTEVGKARLVTLLECATLIPDPGEEKWNWQVCVDGHVVYEQELKGRGSCPILVTRWRTFSNSPWGYGPLLKAVPDARTLDQLRYAVLKNLGKAVDPPTMYDDDGVTNPEGGVDAGMWIPRLPGSKQDQLESGRLELAFFEEEKLREKVKRAAFQSGPYQRGKTPPTLGQWMDEKAEEGRRLEMPTGKLYAEGVVAVVERTEYLLLQAGKIDPMLKAGDKKIVQVRPLNPLARQQDFDRANTARQLMEIIMTAFGPQVAAAVIDAGATIENLQAALNDEIVIVRDADAADPMLRGVLGQPGMAPGLETAPPGAPAPAPA